MPLAYLEMLCESLSNVNRLGAAIVTTSVVMDRKKTLGSIAQTSPVLMTRTLRKRALMLRRKRLLFHRLLA